MAADESWKSAEVLAAEAALGRAVRATEQDMRAAEQLSRPTAEPSTEDIRRVSRWARSPEASAETRALAARVARGELSWRDVLTGRAGADAGVRAAMARDRARFGEVCRGGPPSGVDDAATATAARDRRPEPRSWDENEDEGLRQVLRRRAW
ncbi:hypothetical protein [Goodfellowiella coeruleoviolacea]|uniref:Uncharacterized protein n=1 Tax=Goodfellowiella coeruleoviolacea TaxID=334858 RepID=A0AAE3KKZ1_9PSEU|nr:hypothetical protein [Goodfellowiella coeruleoviolacea]MCP2165953.1 hypothetical protein [Goodfellowiella coeruleoviolacea]